MSDLHVNEQHAGGESDRTDLATAANMKYLTADQAKFEETPGQMLSVQIGEETYPTVFLHCSFPHKNNRIFISVRTDDNKEVGIIRSLDDFPSETIQLLEKHINLRYFAPKILKIRSIKDEFGYSYWDTETSAGSCYFTVRTGRGNVTSVTDEKVLVTDVDGNRFVIEDVTALTDKEYRMLEMLMS